MDFPHNFIILIDMLSQPWDLLGFRFLTIARNVIVDYVQQRKCLICAQIQDRWTARILQWSTLRRKKLLKIDAF